MLEDTFNVYDNVSLTMTMTKTVDQQAKCSKIFDLVDRDKSGFIDKKGKSLMQFIVFDFAFRIRFSSEVFRLKV